MPIEIFQAIFENLTSEYIEKHFGNLSIEEIRAYIKNISTYLFDNNMHGKSRGRSSPVLPLSLSSTQKLPCHTWCSHQTNQVLLWTVAVTVYSQAGIPRLCPITAQLNSCIAQQFPFYSLRKFFSASFNFLLIVKYTQMNKIWWPRLNTSSLVVNFIFVPLSISFPTSH